MTSKMACKYKSCEMLAIFIARICCTNNTMNIEILQNTKGNPKIVCDGYMYNKSRTLKSGRISWRCERKGTKCTGAITTCSAMADPKVERPHNHDARPAAADALKARNQAKEVARATGENPAAVINAARANAPEAARVLMGPDTALKRMVQRVRSKETPRTPDSLAMSHNKTCICNIIY